VDINYQVINYSKIKKVLLTSTLRELVNDSKIEIIGKFYVEKLIF